MKKRTTLKLKPEAIKPGLNVLVDWYRDDTVYYPGVVIKKLRKNWLIKIDKRSPYDFHNNYQNVSVPYESMTANSGFTKEGRMLMDTPEDKQHLFSKDHVDYVMSLLIVPENKTIKQRSVDVIETSVEVRT